MQSDLEQFSETTSTEAFALQNHKLLKVHLDQVTIQAKLGSMVAYQGEVSFEHAGAVRLDVSQAPTYADAQAAVAWSSGVTSSVKTDIKLKSFIGLGSGESFQMAFGGEGWVLVQPSEGRIQVTSPGGG